MGINSVNSQMRGLGLLAVEAPVVANSTGAYYEENGVQYFFGDDGLVYSPNNEILDTALANQAFNAISDNLQPIAPIVAPVAVEQVAPVVLEQVAPTQIPAPLPAPMPLETFTVALATQTTQPLPKALPKTEDKPNTLLYVGISVGVLALCGGAYWYFSK